MSQMSAVLEPLLRSILFAPANHPRRAQRLTDFGADAVVLDLEDAVADTEKVGARKTVPTSLASYHDVIRCVRVNALGTGLALDDLAAIVSPSLDCVVVPKIESSAELGIFDACLQRLEEDAGFAPGRIRLLPIVETARGILRVEEIASAAIPRVITLVFGIGDYTADLGISPSRSAAELLYPRSRIVLACRAYRLAPPVDGPVLDISDESAFREDSRRSRELGFQGRLAIHPSQVALANEVYGQLPSEELAAIQQIVESFEAAARGGSASIQIGGRFVDYPIYRQALHQLDQHHQASARMESVQMAQPVSSSAETDDRKTE